MIYEEKKEHNHVIFISSLKECWMYKVVGVSEYLNTVDVGGKWPALVLVTGIIREYPKQM